MLVDYRRFERKMRWKEFFHDKEDDNNLYIPPIFPQEKSNLPPKGGSPLNNFLVGVKSELTGTHFNKFKPNISKSENEALKSIIKLQKDQKIVIKPCDKGDGIIICNYNDYVSSCETDLNSKSATNQPNYSKITASDLEEAKSKIKETLYIAHRNELITNVEYRELLPTDKKPGKFYQIF
jgi:hypothetical protein